MPPPAPTTGHCDDSRLARPALPSGVGPEHLLAATHAWRCILRQATAYLDALADASSDPATRTALTDVVMHLNHACALLTRIQRSDHTSAGRAAPTSQTERVTT